MGKVAARQAEFDSMDTDQTGTITFDKFLNWTLEHIAQKVQDAQSGVRFTAPEPEQPAVFTAKVQYSQPVPWDPPAPVQIAAAPVQYASAPMQYMSAPTYAAAP